MKDWLPFKEARKLVRHQKFSSSSEFKEWHTQTRQSKIPFDPANVYKKAGWIDYYDWLGKKKPEEFVKFEDARKFVRSLGLKSYQEWRNWLKTENRPSYIPAAPDKAYRNKGWKGFRNFLGGTGKTNFEKNASWLSYAEARSIVRKLKLSGQNEWFKYQRSK